MLKLDFHSLDFYSRFEWREIGSVREISSRRTVSKSFLVLRSRDEERLDAEAIPYRVLDRRPWLQESWLQASLRPDLYPLQSLSLVALEPSTRTLPVSRGERGCDRPDGFRYISDPR